MATKEIKVIGEESPDPAREGQVRRLVKRYATFTLPEPYDDIEITGWVNHPNALLRNADTEEKKLAALKQIIVAHNVVDFDGNPYPPADDDNFWREIPDELGVVIMDALTAQKGKLPPPSGAR